MWGVFWGEGGRGKTSGLVGFLEKKKKKKKKKKIGTIYTNGESRNLSNGVKNFSAYSYNNL